MKEKNENMIGNQELSIMLSVFGIFFIMIAMLMGMPFMYAFILFIGMTLMMSATIWLCYIISYNKLQPLINRIKPEGETVWIRITKSGKLTFQVAKNGPYGQTKGIANHENADVIDKGDFPIRCINGNPAILMWDMTSSNINPKLVVGWKQMVKKFGIRSSREAYVKAKEARKVV